jgi:hypothetical protein
MKRIEFLLALLMLCGSTAGASPPTLVDRLRESLFVRTAPDGEKFGNAELDILVWEESRYLLKSPSRAKAMQVLDDFIRSHGERLVRDPVERAMLQRDLWALFDRTANYNVRPDSDASQLRALRDLQRRLVTVIQRLAMPADMIDRLPDSYTNAETRLQPSGFPQGIFAPDSPWLLVGRTDDTTAAEHTRDFGGRSLFLVFVKFPGGRDHALRYLKELREFAPALVYSNESLTSGKNFQDRHQLRTNRATPQFPAGTQWALVRLLCLIDNQGLIRATRMIESVQTRTYSSVPETDNNFDALRNAQVVAEFQMDRKHGFALRAVEEGEREFQFVHFRSMGVDPFEHMSASEWDSSRDRMRGQTLKTCMKCHLARGILSVNTYSNFGYAATKLDGSTLEHETSATLRWKARQFDWGLLNGLWAR